MISSLSMASIRDVLAVSWTGVLVSYRSASFTVRLNAMPHSIPATLIPGDGIGPEIVDATVAVLDALGAPFEWDRQIAGLEGLKRAGDPLPAAALDSIKRTRLA